MSFEFVYNAPSVTITGNADNAAIDRLREEMRRDREAFERDIREGLYEEYARRSR